MHLHDVAPDLPDFCGLLLLGDDHQLGLQRATNSYPNGNEEGRSRTLQQEHPRLCCGKSTANRDDAKPRHVALSGNHNPTFSISSAMALFCSWLRSRVHLTAMSVGMWRIRTAVSTCNGRIDQYISAFPQLSPV